MGRERRKSQASASDRESGDRGDAPYAAYFEAAFVGGDYSALILLGFAFLELGWVTTAYAAWYLALLKDQPDAKELVVEMSRYMTTAQILLAENDVNRLLPRINRAHCH